MLQLVPAHQHFPQPKPDFLRPGHPTSQRAPVILRRSKALTPASEGLRDPALLPWPSCIYSAAAGRSPAPTRQPRPPRGPGACGSLCMDERRPGPPIHAHLRSGVPPPGGLSYGPVPFLSLWVQTRCPRSALATVTICREVVFTACPPQVRTRGHIPDPGTPCGIGTLGNTRSTTESVNRAAGCSPSDADTFRSLTNYQTCGTANPCAGAEGAGAKRPALTPSGPSLGGRRRPPVRSALSAGASSSARPRPNSPSSPHASHPAATAQPAQSSRPVRSPPL